MPPRFAPIFALLALAGCDGSETADVPAGNAAIAIADAAPVALPPILGSPDPARPLVVIDPGHGGRDPGASAEGGVLEKDVTLEVGRALRDSLAASGRVRVAMTRDEDRHVGLEDRFRLARRMGARLFISVHADAAERGAARGATIYTLSEVASDARAARLAERENAAGVGTDADAGLGRSVNHILVDLAQRESMEASADFARLLYREASPLIPFQPDYHRFASLIVLKAPDVPSILFESGYLTNPEDIAFLRSAEGRRRIAEGVTRAVEIHFAVKAGTGT